MKKNESTSKLSDLEFVEKRFNELKEKYSNYCFRQSGKSYMAFVKLAKEMNSLQQYAITSLWETIGLYGSTGCNRYQKDLITMRAFINNLFELINLCILPVECHA